MTYRVTKIWETEVEFVEADSEEEARAKVDTHRVLCDDIRVTIVE